MKYYSLKLLLRNYRNCYQQIQQCQRNLEETENSFSLDLSFSTQNIRTRTSSEIWKAAARISKVKLQLVPQPLIQLITCLCSRMYQ